LVDIQRW